MVCSMMLRSGIWGGGANLWRVALMLASSCANLRLTPLILAGGNKTSVGASLKKHESKNKSWRCALKHDDNNLEENTASLYIVYHLVRKIRFACGRMDAIECKLSPGISAPSN